MTIIEPDHTIAVFQQLHVVDGVHYSRVCGPAQLGGRRDVHRHNSPRTVTVIIAGRLGARSAVYLIDFRQGVIQIRYFINHCVDFIGRILVKAQGVDLNGLFNVIVRREVAIREYRR